MDDRSRALDEVLLRDLECPVCMQYMVPPIQLCTNGHNICSRCRGKVQRCLTCRAEFLETRNVALENIARRLKYPCANRQSGCLDRFSIEHIAEHQAVCVYGEIKCPFQVNWNCSWKGFKSDLKEHAKTVHPGCFFEESTLRSSLFWDRILKVLSCFGELFVHYKRIVDGTLYCAVQLIGTSSEASKYKCEFTLRAANGIEQISKTFLVQGYSEDWETSFNSGKCLRLDEATVRNFLVGNKLNLTVTLSTV
jgi:E3 ubiquitin-protein ligase SIAH1